MRTFSPTRMAGRAIAILALSTAGLTIGASTAFADTSNATAQAVNLQLGTASVVNSGTETATNPGGQPTVTAGSTPALSILGTQSTITAGLLVQTAVANGDGTSAACAGLVGAGGQIQIGSDGNCTVTNFGSGGVTINLPNLVVLRANAILEQCTASSTGTPTASAQLVDATLNVAGQPAVTLPVNPAPGTTQSAFLLSLGLNVQSHPTAGEIQGTALTLDVLNTIHLAIGTVTCGPNAVTPGTSIFPVKSLPIAGGTALVAGAVLVPMYRRRRRAQIG